MIHSMNVKNQVSEVLHECQLRTYKSVAFPAIGTGVYFHGELVRAVMRVFGEKI